MIDFKLPPPEDHLYLDEYVEWYESTAHTTSEDKYESGARSGWVAAMRFIKHRASASEIAGSVSAGRVDTFPTDQNPPSAEPSGDNGDGR